MTLIYASKYNEISTKLEQMRATVGAAWSTVTTYGSGAQPSMSAGTQITAQQVNALIEAFNDFELKWTAGSNCSVTLTCSVTTSCSGTAGDCKTTTSCSGTAGTCRATGGSFGTVYSSKVGNRCSLASNMGLKDTNRGTVYTGHTT